MILAVLELGVLGVFGVDYLQFTHAVDMRSALARKANRQSIVSGGRQLEFKTYNKIFQLIFDQQIPPLPLFTADGTLFHLVTLYVANPAIKVLAVEDRRELAILVRQHLVGSSRIEFTDEDVPPANFAAMGLQLNGALGKQWLGAVPVVVHRLAVNDQLAVEPDAGRFTDLDNTILVPFFERSICQD